MEQTMSADLPHGYSIVNELLGYVDRYEFEAGDEVDVHAAGPAGPVTVDVVRLRTFDTRVEVEGDRAELIPTITAVAAQVGPQPLEPGSFLISDGAAEIPAGTARVSFDTWVFPTYESDDAQGIVALVGVDGTPRLGLALVNGSLHLVAGSGADRVDVALDAPVVISKWSHIEVGVDASGAIRGRISPKQELFYRPEDDETNFANSLTGVAVPDLFETPTRLVVAGLGARRSETGTWSSFNAFTGRVDTPTVIAESSVGVEELLFSYDFSQDMAAAVVPDLTGRSRDGVLVNAPTRAVTGRTWDGTETDFRRAPEQYTSIHFYADDLEDPGWPTVASFTIPDGLPSGAYAVRLRSGNETDHVPFFVVPARGQATSDVAILMPTWTYQAYANGRVYIDPGVYIRNGWTDIVAELHERDFQLERFEALAGCVYDVHLDGTGRSWSTVRRPILNARPEYQSSLVRGPRHFAADLFLVTWLEQEVGRFDIITDSTLHDRGAEALEPYKVVLTGGHPEYCSSQMLDGIEQYLGGGGSLMYLGGNSFWWVTTQDPNRPHLIQVRRGLTSAATWESLPGEVHDSTTGEDAGGWRRRGRAPNRIVGSGITSQGWDSKAPGYRRTAEGHQPEFDWIFDGVVGEEFGHHGLVMGGAAGDEVDKFDPKLSSPGRVAVVATSTGHSHYYKPIIDDIQLITDGLDGDKNPDVRSDITYIDTGLGGAVFGVGSITWIPSMATDSFDNDVAQITANVLRRFRTDAV
jgi:N,N-dimethylformamidase